MANTYTLIQSVTVGSGGAASIEFGSIPQTYTDLVVVGSCRTAAAFISNGFYIQFNGSSTNLSWKRLLGNPSVGAQSDSDDAGVLNGASSTASAFGSFTAHIPNYAGSTNKSMSIDSASESNDVSTRLVLVAGLWSQTSAITSLKIISATSATIQQYSSASLYGIKNS